MHILKINLKNKKKGACCHLVVENMLGHIFGPELSLQHPRKRKVFRVGEMAHWLKLPSTKTDGLKISRIHLWIDLVLLY